MAIYANNSGSVKNLTDSSSAGLNCAYGEFQFSTSAAYVSGSDEIDISCNFTPKIIWLYFRSTGSPYISSYDGWLKPDEIDQTIDFGNSANTEHLTITKYSSSVNVRLYIYSKQGYRDNYVKVWIFG